MATLHAHCRRDLFQACWKHLLDVDFLNTYCHGIILQCPDGILRRVFPHIFTYSADYPEKQAHFSFPYLNTNQYSRVLIATIKDMSVCPCPHCLMLKASFDLLGLFRDMQDHLTNFRAYFLEKVTKAHEFVYCEGNTVDGSKV
jgi:hypothetical protein